MFLVEFESESGVGFDIKVLRVDGEGRICARTATYRHGTNHVLMRERERHLFVRSFVSWGKWLWVNFINI